MKKNAFILLSGLFLFQPAFSSTLPLADKKANIADSENKKKRPVNVQLLRRTSTTRSLPPMILGFITDGRLHIRFDVSIENEYLQVTDADSCVIVYSETFSGNTLIIPLATIGENYVVEVL